MYCFSHEEAGKPVHTLTIIHGAESDEDLRSTFLGKYTAEWFHAVYTETDIRSLSRMISLLNLPASQKTALLVINELPTDRFVKLNIDGLDGGLDDSVPAVLDALIKQVETHPMLVALSVGFSIKTDKMKALAEALIDNDTIINLYLVIYQDENEDQVNLVAEMIKGNVKLRTLGFSVKGNRQLRANEMPKIFKAIGENTSIQTLNLSKYSVDRQGLEAMIEATNPDSKSVLSELYFFEISGDPIDFTDLKTYKNGHIKKIYVQSVEYRNNLDILHGFPSCTSLIIDSEKIGPANQASLAKFVGNVAEISIEFKGLKKLELTDFANALPSDSKSLRALKIVGCTLKIFGDDAIKTLVEKCPQLTSIIVDDYGQVVSSWSEIFIFLDIYLTNRPNLHLVIINRPFSGNAQVHTLDKETLKNLKTKIKAIQKSLKPIEIIGFIDDPAILKDLNESQDKIHFS